MAYFSTELITILKTKDLYVKKDLEGLLHIPAI